MSINFLSHFLLLYITRLNRTFVAEPSGHRPLHGNDPRYTTNPNWKDLVLFYEYFNGDSGKGCGAT